MTGAGTTNRSPVVWSIAGTDSGGGAGLAADLRAAEVMGVHLCPVVAAVTAQHSRAVTQVAPVDASLLDAQLAALADDLPPQAIKTGLLGNADSVRRIADWVERLRSRFGPIPLVVDPVLGASSGADFADGDTLAAYRTRLLPLATLSTPNRREAERLLGPDRAVRAVPALAQALLEGGPEGVCITGGDDAGDEARDWLQTPHARGWLALPRVATPHTHGTGCSFATAAAAALAQGFVTADGLVLAKMLTAHALRHARVAGRGAGPVVARPGFAQQSEQLPVLSFDDTPVRWVPAAPAHDACTLYGIVDRAERVGPVARAGAHRVQLRLKAPASVDALHAALRQAHAACAAAGAELIVNDHWRAALALGLRSVHLGQEDLMAAGAEGRQALREAGVRLGVSSHSLWELARARGLAPAYIACGPVWATTTKAMPWRPQGLHNLRSWVALAGHPVVAIGGVLQPAQAEAAAAAGAAAVCLVRALDAVTADDASALERWHAALERGARAAPPLAVPERPMPSLEAHPR